MKFFKGTIEAVTMNAQVSDVVRTSSEVILPASNRHNALMAMLDMGQAMARGANSLQEKTYFRVVDLNEAE